MKLQSGDRVWHSIHGLGTVFRAAGTGRNSTVTVNFDRLTKEGTQVPVFRLKKAPPERKPEWMKEFPRHGEAWEEEEEEELLQQHEQGFSLDQIARALGRTRKSIERKLEKLGAKANDAAPEIPEAEAPKTELEAPISDLEGVAPPDGFGSRALRSARNKDIHKLRNAGNSRGLSQVERDEIQAAVRDMQANHRTNPSVLDKYDYLFRARSITRWESLTDVIALRTTLGIPAAESRIIDHDSIRVPRSMWEQDIRWVESFSVRLKNQLASLEIEVLGDIHGRSESSFLEASGFGKGSLKELMDYVNQRPKAGDYYQHRARGDVGKVMSVTDHEESGPIITVDFSGLVGKEEFSWYDQTVLTDKIEVPESIEGIYVEDQTSMPSALRAILVADGLEVLGEFQGMRWSDVPVAFSGLRSIANAIQKAASEPGESEDRDSIGRLVKEAHTLSSELDEREQLLLEEMIFSPHAPTLEKMSEHPAFMVSRERVRQIRNRLMKKLDTRLLPHAEVVAEAFRDYLGHVASVKQINAKIEEVLGTSSRPGTILARQMLEKELDYEEINGVGMDSVARNVADALRNSAYDLQDTYGLVLQYDLKEKLPSLDWYEYWNDLVNQAGLYSLGDYVTVKASALAKIAAALLKRESPMSVAQLAEATGLGTVPVRTALGRAEDIIRADMKRWGFRDWIDDEYEGIAAEIEQRIHEDNGATKLERLLSELPEKFGVTEVSVNTIVRTAPRFTLQGDDVRLADLSSLSLPHLEDEVSGYDDEGDPYWSFDVKQIYFKGFSLTGLPQSIADKLGSEIDGGTIKVELSYPTDCRSLTVSWASSSVTGPTLGRLSKPLEKLGVSEGGMVDLVLRKDGKVELRTGSAGRGEEGNTPEGSSASDIFGQIQRRREI